MRLFTPPRIEMCSGRASISHQGASIQRGTAQNSLSVDKHAGSYDDGIKMRRITLCDVISFVLNASVLFTQENAILKFPAASYGECAP
jgi:hypothetical protein